MPARQATTGVSSRPMPEHSFCSASPPRRRGGWSRPNIGRRRDRGAPSIGTFESASRRRACRRRCVWRASTASGSICVWRCRSSRSTPRLARMRSRFRFPQARSRSPSTSCGGPGRSPAPRPMPSRADAAAITVRACAKINLTLRITGVRADGYHELRSVFQSLALHDTLICARRRGPFAIECDEPGCPTDASNLVWRAAEGLWRAAGRQGLPRDVVVRIVKRIPLQSGLGGGSSDAAAALRGLSRLWRLRVTFDTTHAIAASIGADVPFFLEGGAALGLERGDLLFPLRESPPQWAVLVMPP